jgi:Fur family iron response transcriptional regulator
MSEASIQTQNHGDVVRLLRQHGITPTAQRVVIASAMLARPQHLTADQVLDLTRESGRKVSKATVYNTLGLFARKGLIRELSVDSNRAFYDSSTHTHAHFYNIHTQELHDVPEGALEIELPTSAPAGTEIERVEVVVHVRPKRAG